MTQDKHTIEDVIFKHFNDCQWYAPILDNRLKAAMTEYASLNRQGCRWVKASERLQGDDQDAIVKWRINEEVWCADHCTGKDLKEQMKHSGHEYFWLDESIEPCATSSENYWKQRCEAAELVMEQTIYYHDDAYTQANDKWQQLKSQTPSPTGDRDCEELKKEVERLKGLIEKAHWQGYKDGKYQGGGAYSATESFILFKTENNL